MGILVPTSLFILPQAKGVLVSMSKVIPFPSQTTPSEEDLDYQGKITIQAYQVKSDQQPFLKIDSDFDSESSMILLDIAYQLFDP